MEKSVIIFLLMPFAVFSQTLKFDIMAKYSIIREEFNNENSIYGISTNSNYFMRVLNNPNGSQTAQIFDLKSLNKHEYDIIETKSNDNNSIEVKFVYLNTNSFSNSSFHSSVSNVYYDFERISEENEIETVKLIVYKNKSKKRINKNYELKILKSEFNLFPLFRFACFHPFQITELNYNSSGLVTSCTSVDGLKIILKDFEEVNLQVELPSK